MQDPRQEELETEPRTEREGGAMGFLDHLDELRATLIKCILALLIACVLAAIFMPTVMDYLQYPFRQGTEGMQDVRLVTTSPLGVFTVIFQIIFLSGFTVSLPFILVFAAQFVAPALVAREKRLLRPVLLASMALFLLGVVFAFYLIIPSTVRISLTLNEQMAFDVVWSADRYYSMFLWITLAMGASFQFPLVMLLLVRLGFLTAEKLAKWRRIAVVLMFVFAAIVTPTPDPITQTMVAVPLYVLYELSIWIARIIERKMAESEPE